MIVEFDKSFIRYLKKINDKSTLSRVESLINKLEFVKSLSDIPEINMLTGFKNYYKVRIGDHRIGFEKVGTNKIRLIIIANRKDIYKRFP